MHIQFRIKKELVTEELINKVGSYTNKMIEPFYDEDLNVIKPCIWWTEPEYLKDDIYRTFSLIDFPFMHVVMFMKEFPDFELESEQMIGHNGHYNFYRYHSENSKWEYGSKIF